MAETIIKKMGLSSGVLTRQDVKIRRNLRDMSFLFTAVLASFAVVTLVFAFLWTRVTVVNTGYDISRANSAKTALIDRNKRLRIEFLKLKSPERIEKIALTELGLVHPDGEQTIKIR